MRDMLMRLTAAPAVVIAGLVAGATFGIWQGYNEAAYTAAAFVEVHQGAVRGLNVLLPVMGLVAIVMTAVQAFLARRRPTLWGYLAAAVLLVAAGLITRLFNQPINDIVTGWGANGPGADWQTLRDTWWTWHVVRTLLSGLAFAALTVTTLLDGAIEVGAPPISTTAPARS
jgi:uncharacterized membrane protein